MPKKKGDALSLQDFHQKIEVSGASPPAEDALPRGPSGLSGGDGTATRKWIAEWGGRAEELPTDPSGPSSVAVRNETAMMRQAGAHSTGAVEPPPIKYMLRPGTKVKLAPSLAT